MYSLYCHAAAYKPHYEYIKELLFLLAEERLAGAHTANTKKMTGGWEISANMSPNIVHVYRISRVLRR